jgi:hypothetical protein
MISVCREREPPWSSGRGGPGFELNFTQPMFLVIYMLLSSSFGLSVVLLSNVRWPQSQQSQRQKLPMQGMGPWAADVSCLESMVRFFFPFSKLFCFHDQTNFYQLENVQTGSLWADWGCSPGRDTQLGVFPMYFIYFLRSPLSISLYWVLWGLEGKRLMGIFWKNTTCSPGGAVKNGAG